jgi:hypothetical protein
MPYFKNTIGLYRNDDCVDNVINYVCDPLKTPSGFIGGLSVLTTNTEDIIMQFNMIKEIYHKEDGKQVRHFVLSFSPYYRIEDNNLFNMARLIAAYYADNYQIIYAIHEDKSHQHIHFVMNTVSFRDGKKYSLGRGDYYNFMSHIGMIVNMDHLNYFDMEDTYDID